MEPILENRPILSFRQPSAADGPAIHNLVRHCPELDANSRYAYLLLATHFSHTCLLALANGVVVGFVSGYRIPNRPETLFVWQIGVDPAWRGRGVAGNLLSRLLDGLTPPTLFIETTITTSNTASQRLFVSLARRLGTTCVQEAGFGESLFAPSQHEAEHLFRIGPLVHADGHQPAVALLT